MRVRGLLEISLAGINLRLSKASLILPPNCMVLGEVELASVTDSCRLFDHIIEVPCCWYTMWICTSLLVLFGLSSNPSLNLANDFFFVKHFAIWFDRSFWFFFFRKLSYSFNISFWHFKPYSSIGVPADWSLAIFPSMKIGLWYRLILYWFRDFFRFLFWPSSFAASVLWLLFRAALEVKGSMLMLWVLWLVPAVFTAVFSGVLWSTPDCNHGYFPYSITLK